MKNIILVVILSLSFNAIKAQTFKQKLDSTLNQLWDGTKYYSDYKLDYTYDADCKLSITTWSKWDATKKKLAFYNRTENTRDSKGNLIKAITYKWRNSQNSFYIANLTEYTYDTKNNLTLELQSGFDTSNNQMINLAKFEKIYDNTNNLINYYYSGWDKTLNSYIYYQRNDLTYFGNNLVYTNMRYSWDKTTKAWTNGDKTIYEYDGKGFEIKKTYISWHPMYPNGFDTTDIYEYSYDAKNNLEQNTIIHKDNTKWTVSSNSVRYIYTYDSKGNILSETFQLWNVSLNSFGNSGQITYTYDVKNNIDIQINSDWDNLSNKWIYTSKLENLRDTAINLNELILPYTEERNNLYFKNKLNREIVSEWNKKSSNWTNKKKTSYSYSYTNINSTNKPIDSPELMIFPNPASEKVYIHLINFKGYLDVKVFDITGKISLEESLFNEDFVNISSLNKGIYFVKVYDGTNVLGIRKLLKN